MKVRVMNSSPNDPIVEQYFQEIEDSKGLPSEVEKELAQRIQQGDEEALKKLVHSNLRFVVTIAKHYLNSGLPFPELISIGNVGLIMAAKRFDGTKGFKFITYAVWWIRQAIQQALKEQHIVRLPSNKIDELTRMKNVLSTLEQKLGREPESDEIAEELKILPEEMDILLDLAKQPVSLETPCSLDEPNRCVGDLIPDRSRPTMDEMLQQEDLKAEITRALSKLTGRESQVISMYYGLEGNQPMTLEEIGAHCGRTRERIRQIKEKTLLKLRSSSRNKALWDYFSD